MFGMVAAHAFSGASHANINEFVTVSVRSSWFGVTTSEMPDGTHLTITVDPWESWVSGQGLVDVKGMELENGRYILPEENSYSVIARVGDSGTPFFVGTMIQLIATEMESLRFTMSEYPASFSDNDGSLLVTVVETPPPTAATLGVIGLALALWAKRRFG